MRGRRNVTDQTPQNFKANDQGPDKAAEKTPAAVKESGVIATQTNQEVHEKAFALAHADDKHPSGIMPAIHESFGIKGELNPDDTGKKQTKTKHSKIEPISDDPHPTRMMAAMTPEAEARIKAQKQAKYEQISQSATLMAIEAGSNPAMQPVALNRQYADSLPESDPRKQKLTELSRELAAEYSPKMRAHYTQKDMTNTPEGWLTVAQKIGQLPIDKQFEVIGSGLAAGLEKYRYDERERTWGQLIGTVQGTSEVLQGLAKIADFGAACILGDNETAGQMGEELGTALGQTIVGGVRLFQAADQYLFNIGYTGDYAKPFRDVVAVGQKLDQQWNGLPPREQERIKTKLITELLESGAIGAAGASTIQKASKFTEVLDAVAMQAQELHAASRPVIKKAAQAVSDAVDELLQPVGDTGMGVKMPIPKNPLKDETKMLMSKSDDIGPKRPEGGRPREPVPEKFRASPEFIASVQQVLAQLSEGERQFLAKHDVAIKPIKRMEDKFPHRKDLAACYDASENTIYVPEEVPKLGSFVQNYDLEFAFRHEFGHAFNAKSDSLGEYISNFDHFIEAFRNDAQKIPSDVLDELKLSKKFKVPEAARDEVFADMYAHAAGLQSQNPYSQKMKEWFPNCLKFVKEMPKP